MGTKATLAKKMHANCRNTPVGQVARNNCACRPTWDGVTNGRVSKLHPFIRCRAKDFINDVENNLSIKLRITGGLRTFAISDEYYCNSRKTRKYCIKLGYTKGDGQWKSNAKGGQSYHNYGLAIDVVVMKNGVTPVWKDLDKSIAKIGKKHGFEWGGDWKKTKDYPHFQITSGNSTKELLKKIKNGNVRGDGYVSL